MNTSTAGVTRMAMGMAMGPVDFFFGGGKHKGIFI